MCELIQSWIQTQQKPWSDEDTIHFINELPLSYCITLQQPIRSELPEGKASPLVLLDLIRSRAVQVYLYTDIEQLYITIIQPNVVVHRITYSLPKPVINEKEIEIENDKEIEKEVEVEAPHIIDHTKDKEQEEFDVIKIGDYFVIKGTNVVINVDEYCVMGYLSNQTLIKEQNQEVVEVCSQYELPFSS
jgi:hypothetical protein